MAAIAWTEEARRWIEDIFEYIAADNPGAAARTVQEIYETGRKSSRPFQKSGTVILSLRETSEFCSTGITESHTS